MMSAVSFLLITKAFDSLTSVIALFPLEELLFISVRVELASLVLVDEAFASLAEAGTLVVSHVFSTLANFSSGLQALPEGEAAAFGCCSAALAVGFGSEVPHSSTVTDARMRSG